MTQNRLLTSLPLLLAVGFGNVAIAEQATESDAKLDRIESKLDKLVSTAEKQNKAYLDQPLGNRTQGIEFNFFRVLTLGKANESLSGTYSRFNTENNTELAFPIMYSKGEHDDDIGGSLTSFTADVHYRKYLGERLDGFYISGFSRFTQLSGTKNETSSSQGNSKGSETKLGIGVGIGYRVISTNGFYWGASMSVGRNLIGDSDIFYSTDNISADLDDEEMILDIEFFKFGYAF